VWYFVGLQTPYNPEIQQDSQSSSQVRGVYVSSVGPPYVAPHQTLVSGSYEQHHAAAGIHQPASNPSPEHQIHTGQQVPAHRPVYGPSVPSAMPQGQPPSASYSQPAVSFPALSHTVYYFVYSMLRSAENVLVVAQ